MIVDTEELRRSMAGGATLPAEWYYDPAILRLEQERIFRRNWHYAGRADEVAKPGTWFSCFAGTIPVVVTHDQEGTLNAFVNVCRHRSHVIATGAGQRQTLQCGYHAWTYGLDGKLRVAPRSEREANFDPEQFSLLPVQIGAWGPLLFVNPDLEAPPLAAALGKLPEHVAASGVEVDRLRFRERREWHIEADWKIAMENYLECYHCPVAHPGFSKVIDVDPDAYKLTFDGLVSSQYGTPRDAALRGDANLPYDARGEIVQAQYHMLWPTTTINIEAGRGNLSVDVTRPNGSGKSIGTTDYFFYEDVPDDTARSIMEFAMQVGREDSGLVEAVQRGLDSGMVTQGRLLLSSEHLIQHFQGLVFDALTAEE